MTHGTPYEGKLEKALELAFGENWWTKFAHPQDVQAFLTATSDEGQQAAMGSMKRDARNVAHGILQAAQRIGLIG